LSSPIPEILKWHPIVWALRVPVVSLKIFNGWIVNNPAAELRGIKNQNATALLDGTLYISV
jgi:hypothetical protein